MFDPTTWAVWDYRATIVNDGVNSGDHQYVFTPGPGNICILLHGRILNGDAAGRTCSAVVRNADDDDIRNVLTAQSVAAAAFRGFPTSEATGDNNTSSDGAPVVISGIEDLRVNVATVAVSENTELTLQMLVLARPPTPTLTSPTDATETETENRVV